MDLPKLLVGFKWILVEVLFAWMLISDLLPYSMSYVEGIKVPRFMPKVSTYSGLHIFFLAFSGITAILLLLIGLFYIGAL